MYNENRKLLFMRDKRKRSTYIASIFELSEKIESKYDTDLCEFTEPMLRDLFDNCYGVLPRVSHNVRDNILLYHDWCLGQGYATCGDIANFKPDATATIRKTMVASPMHLEKELDRFLRPTKDGGTDNVFRCYFELAFLDFDKDEAMALTDSDFHPESMTIGDDPGVLIPAEFFLNLKFCAESPTILEYRTRGEKPRVHQRPPHGPLMRTETILSLNTVGSALQKRKELADDPPGIMFRTVRESGRMYRKYQESLATGAPVNFEDEIREAVRQNCEGKFRSQINNYQSRMRRDLTAKFEDWKQAFYK